jgi:uncharacterized protein (TIGR02452 family)
MAKKLNFVVTMNARKKVSNLEVLSPEWEKYDLSAECHQRYLDQWQILFDKDEDAARRLVQAQTLYYIAHHRKALKPPHAKFITLSPRNFPDLEEISVQQEHPLTITVTPIDGLIAAEKFSQAGQRVVLLNTANPFRKGGNYLRGMEGREEDLFRRTDLSISLDEQAYAPPKGYARYNVFYSDKVAVLRQGLEQQYVFYDKKEFLNISVISSAAYNFKNSGLATDDVRYLESMEKKIILQLETALLQGHTNVILGAFGCGVLKNDPKTVAQVYQKLLLAPRYRNAFAQVEFAIDPDTEATKDHYLAFKAVFDGVYDQRKPLQAIKGMAKRMLERLLD